MPRVTAVKKAQKKQGTCGKCGAEIKKGDPYKWWAFRYGGRRVRCMKPECAPRGSDLTQSKMSGVYAAQEGLEDALDAFRSDFDLEALKGAVEDAANSVREVAEEYRESAQNIEDGFQHETTQSQELAEKGDTLESAADDLENCISGDDFDEESVEISHDEVTEETSLDEIESTASGIPEDAATLIDVKEGDTLKGKAREEILKKLRTKYVEAYKAAKAEAVESAKADWAEEIAGEVENGMGGLDC